MFHGDDAIETGKAMTVMGWLVIKEAGLMLATLVNHVPLPKRENDDTAWLTEDQLKGASRTDVASLERDQPPHSLRIESPFRARSQSQTWETSSSM